jgi:hypothetical protein
VSDDNENAEGADSGNRAGHSDAHRYPNEGEAHAGSLM